MIELILSLKKYSDGAKRWLYLNIISAFFSNVCILINPLLIGLIIKRSIGVNNVDFKYAIIMLVIVAILYIIGNCLLWFSQYCSNNYSTMVIKEIRKKAFNTITNTPFSYLDKMQTGDIMARFSKDADLIYDALSHFFMHFFGGITVILFSLIIMFYLNVYLTIIILLMVPVILIYSAVTKKKRNERFFNLQKLMGKLTENSKEAFDNKKLIEAYNYQEKVKERFDEINDSLAVVGESAYFAASINNPTYRLLTNITYALLGLTSIILNLYGSKVEISTLTSMIMYAAIFAKPFNNFSVLSENFMAGRAGVIRIKEILDLDVEKEEIKFNLEDKATLGDIEFKSVKFSYDEKKELINNFNLKIKPGQKVAIVGKTGSGKSTIINLLIRFYNVNDGEILLDGKNIKDYNRKILRLSFGLVLQEPWLFGGSIKDNIKYGKNDASLNEVIKAAKKAHCHDFIMMQKDGYDTILKDNNNLSLGQKQLITVARAILIDPAILILDEATSNIDSLMEREIQKAFKDVMSKKTTFIIAHRLKTIVDCDVIIVMDKGKIVETGTHSKLMEKDGFYKKLYNSQFIGQEIVE